MIFKTEYHFIPYHVAKGACTSIFMLSLYSNYSFVNSIWLHMVKISVYFNTLSQCITFFSIDS